MNFRPFQKYALELLLLDAIIYIKQDGIVPLLQVTSKLCSSGHLSTCVDSGTFLLRNIRPAEMLQKLQQSPDTQTHLASALAFMNRGSAVDIQLMQIL